MQRYFSNIESLFTSRFYLSKFVLPLFAIRETFRMAVPYFSYKGDRRMRRVFIFGRERCKRTVALWRFRGSEMRAGEGSRVERIRKDRCIEPHAIRRNRSFLGTLPPPRSILCGVLSRRGARVHKHACTTAMHYSQQRHFRGSLREALVCLIRAKLNFRPTVITMTITTQKISVAKVLFINDKIVSTSEAFNIRSIFKIGINRFFDLLDGAWWIKKR